LTWPQATVAIPLYSEYSVSLVHHVQHDYCLARV
jgi:hypothetical protein